MTLWGVYDLTVGVQSLVHCLTFALLVEAFMPHVGCIRRLATLRRALSSLAYCACLPRGMSRSLRLTACWLLRAHDLLVMPLLWARARFRCRNVACSN
ncbi:conserved hypothetical protein [Ricinus communis]|uniref:Uncharacterized protein n=1 Tax=Ricinus communis TaxID=3988 RepID=B9RX13_RICCO|nr:conserved hypothetical protein [Ricinus communis]